MMVKCRKCKSEMEFPFYDCTKCGWVTRGRYREMADKFALNYIKVNGNDMILRRKLELARKGKFSDKDLWEADTGVGKEPRVRCFKCHGEMIFPYIQCGSCGWIARREMRAMARDFAKKYIEANPEKREELEIIWDEENRRSRMKKVVS
jgi:hypothetical protein